MRVVFATGNKHKLQEAREIFTGVEILSILDLDKAFDPDEYGKSFLENAVIKAEAARMKSGGLPVLSDDSGLVVPALGGAPGIHSARWGGVNGDHARNRAKLRTDIRNITDRRAHFLCTAVLLDQDGAALVATGRVDGTLIDEERGEGGFGYDPMFIPTGDTRTLAQMSPAEKNALSHRGRAFRHLAAMMARQFPQEEQ
ncbi:MAG TPA: RdgB/HAM1 family non-canonical purine NTP pyrophosphatase [bacterium]|nr:RdgB/HAM1 family non-canonical purine NTP pyrophosphatase [bacterium]